MGNFFINDVGGGLENKKALKKHCPPPFIRLIDKFGHFFLNCIFCTHISDLIRHASHPCLMVLHDQAQVRCPDNLYCFNLFTVNTSYILSPISSVAFSSWPFVVTTS